MIGNPYIESARLESARIAMRALPQCPTGFASDILRPKERGLLVYTSPRCEIATTLNLTAHRARRRRRPKLGFDLYKRRLDVAFLIEDIIVGGVSLTKEETFLADMFYSNVAPPVLQTKALTPGERVVLSVRNIGRVQAVLRACIWTIPADREPCPPSCPQVVRR